MAISDAALAGLLAGLLAVACTHEPAPTAAAPPPAPAAAPVLAAPPDAPPPAAPVVFSVSVANPALGRQLLAVRADGSAHCEEFHREKEARVPEARTQALVELARGIGACALKSTQRPGLVNRVAVELHAPGLDCRVERPEADWEREPAPNRLHLAAKALLAETCGDLLPP
jgi:hypothetical protein